MIAELAGQIGHLKGQQPPDENGLTLTIKVPVCSVSKPAAVHRCTACTLAADALGLVTDSGAVYAVQLKQQRYKCLDRLDMAGTATAFMTRLSRQLYVGCSNGDIFCYDLSSNSRLARLPGHRTAVTALSTKADTEQLLSASTDAVLLWDLQTFRQRRMLSSAPYGSSQAGFSPSGNLIAAAAEAAGTVKVWHAKSLQDVCQLSIPCDMHQQPFTVSCVSFSLDEKWLVAGCKCPALLLVYNLQQQSLQHALFLSEELYGIAQMQLLPDSTSAAVLSTTGCIHFLDLQSCSFTGQLHVTKLGCRATSFSMDSRANSMAVICSDGLIRLYDLGAVRAHHQERRFLLSQQQVQKLDEQQLQQFEAGAALIKSKGAVAHNAGRPNQLRQQVEQVLAEVSNVPPRHKAATKPGRSRRGASNVPTIQVLQLDSIATALNRQKLQQLLAVYGEFPAQYRQVLWEHLLQLPHNSSAFMLLQDRGVHAAYLHLAQQMPGGARSTVAVRLQACLSQLAHWCPVFGEAGFLPRFAFPFVKLCGARAESAFEMVASLLLNWCKGWFELFPNPPLPLLRRFLLLVSHHDLELGSHLQHLGVPLLQQLWHQISGAMSDMLPRQSDWLVFWDHCLAAAAGPAFFYQLLCACLMAQRRMLLAVQDEQHLVRLWEARPAVDIHQVVKQAYRLQESTPEYAALGLRVFSPLPLAAAAAAYPMFSEYPAGSAELQAMERRRIQEAEEALIRRRQVVAELEQRSKQVAFDSAALTAQRQQLVAVDAQRREAMQAIDNSLAAAGARLDDRSKEEKLKQIRLVEEAYQASLSSLRSEWSTELAALKADIEHKRRLAVAALKARQEEEDLKALEFQAQQRLWTLQQQEIAAAGTSALQDAAAAQTAALAAEQQRKAAEWQVEDDARTLRQQHETARRARLVAAAEQEAAKQAAKGLLLAQELQAQEELLKVEHQRCLRQLAEEEAELTAKQLQLQVERQTVLAAAGQEAVQQQAQEHKSRFTNEQQQRRSTVDQQLQALKQRQAELHAAAAEVGAAARIAAAEQQLAQLEQVMSKASQEQELQVQQLLDELEQDRKAHDHAMSVLSAVRAESKSEMRPAVAADASPSLPAGTAESPARPSSSAASLKARLEALTNNIRAHSAAAEACGQAAAYQTTAVAGERSTDLHGVTISHETLHSQSRQQRGGPAAAPAQAGASRSADSHWKTQALSQHPGRDSTDSVESLVRQVESMNVQHALRAAEAASIATVPQQTTSYSSVERASAAGSTTSSSSISVSQELEQLLAETEAEVQRELAYTTAAEASWRVPKQVRPQTAQKAQALSAAERLQPVLEEPSYSSSESPSAAAAKSVGRLPGHVTHSPAASPAASADSSPTRRPMTASSLAPRTIAGGGMHPRPGSEVATDRGGGSPAAAKLALSGLEPLTHHGRVVTGLADLLQRQSPATSSGDGSSGSSKSARQQHQQHHRGHHRPGAELFSPEAPSSLASMLTASSGNTAACSSAQARVMTAGAAQRTGTVLQPVSAADHGCSDVAGDSDCAVYEPVLLGGHQPPAAGASGKATAAGIAATSLGSSPSSTDRSSSQASSRSLSLGAAAAAAELHQHDELETPMLHIGRRTRSPEGQLGSHSKSAAEGLQEAAGFEQMSSSSSERISSLNAAEVAAVGRGSVGSFVESRAGSGWLHRGLDASGKVSVELRRSSSATSQELEDLLQQLAAYEERLLQANPSSDFVAANETEVEGASGMGTSMSSVSWSQTLAGLGSLIPQGHQGMTQ